jgi:N-acetylglutamate synthase-like GNAT family acetyltransferase
MGLDSSDTAMGPGDVVVPASTQTPAPPTDASAKAPATGVQQVTANDIRVENATPAVADDAAQVALLTKIVNAVYSETEADIFVEGYQRTNVTEMKQFIVAGEIAVAYLKSSGEAIGCIRIQKLSDTMGEFGMLALDPVYRGGGLGREMVLFAERHCRETLGLKEMQVELLFPVEFEHAFKMRLQAWYTRMGYVQVKLGIFLDDYPQLAPLLRGPCEYRVSKKSLV